MPLDLIENVGIGGNAFQARNPPEFIRTLKDVVKNKVKPTAAN